MKIYILPSGVTISPFGEAAAESLIVFERLADLQDRVFRDRNLEPVRMKALSDIPDREYFLTFDNVYLTRRAFRDFYKRALAGKQTAVFALPESEFVRRYGALQEIGKRKDAGGAAAHTYRLWYVNGHPGDLAALDAALPLCVKFKEMIWEQPVPPNMFGKKAIRMPVTTSIAFHITHWVTLLWANQMGIFVHWVERITGHPFWTAGRVLLAVGRYLGTGWRQLFRFGSLSTAFGGHAWRRALMLSFNKVGRGCDIHPDAVLQFCILGDHVKVGPQSYLMGSILGDRVVVEEKTKITGTSLGPGCYASQLTILNGVAAYPDGDVCVDGMNFSLTGRNVRLTGFARVLDLRAGGPIRVPYKGKLEPIGQEALGSCFGHGCFIGNDINIAPGREIPNGAVIVQPPDRVLMKTPPDLLPGVPMAVEDGTLRKL